MEEIQQPPKELSKQTIVVLVALVVLISLLGTLTVMNEIGKVQPQVAQTQKVSAGGTSTTEAKVMLNIVPAGSALQDTAKAKVSLNIVPNQG